MANAGGFDYYFCSECAVLRKGRRGRIFPLSLGGRISDVALQKDPSGEKLTTQAVIFLAF